MFKKGLNQSLGLGLVLFLFYLPCFADQQQEPLDEFVITTYYPSPYGVYNELQTNKMAIGDTNKDGSLSSADQPANNGGLLVAGNVGIGGDVAISGKPSWSGKKFEGWYELTDTNPETVCRTPIRRGGACICTCKDTCESFGCTCLQAQLASCAGPCAGRAIGCNENVCNQDCQPGIGGYDVCGNSETAFTWGCVCRCAPTSPKKILVPTFK